MLEAMLEATKTVCKSCKYSEVIGSNDGVCCGYIVKTGHMRIRDESGDMCGSYEKKARRRCKK